jgi:hypothetical protein
VPKQWALITRLRREAVHVAQSPTAVLPAIGDYPQADSRYRILGLVGRELSGEMPGGQRFP